MKNNDAKRFWLSMFIVCCSLLANAYGYSGGSGTLDDPYLISSKAHLKYLSENSSEWGKHFKQIADITFDVGDYSPGGDFYNDGKGFSPIGDNIAGRFNGSYDGDGHTITYLYIWRPEQNYVGMFGYVQTYFFIRNLTLENVVIKGEDFSGGLIGYSAICDVNSCSISGHINGASSVGGLIGEFWITMIAKCDVSANISASGDDIGGLIGKTIPLPEGAQCIISESNATGDVNGDSNVGGLVGHLNQERIDKSFSSGTVQGNINVGQFIGIVDQSAINNCFATGDVVQKSGTDNSVGGFVGKLNSGGINYCYSTCNVIGIEWNPTNKGFIGEYVSGTLSNNYWDTQASGQSASAGQGAGQVEGKTTAEMQQQATFVNWNFSNTWGIYPACNNGYPYLLWQISEPSHPIPANNAVNIPLSGELTWLLPQETNTYDLYFGIQGMWELVQEGANGTPVGNFSYHNLAPDTNYEWHIRAHTTQGTIFGPLWSFTTAPAPASPAYPAPMDGAENVQVFGELAWSSSSGADTYDLLLGTPGNMEALVTGEPAGFSGNYSYTNLAFSTLYHWQIVEYKGGIEFPGPVWSFTTTSAPATPAFPNPADGATEVPLSGSLSWVFSSGVDAYLLLFGKEGSLDTLVASAPAEYTGSYNYTNLDYLTAYQWQIIEIKGDDTIPGPVWSFTSGPPNSLTYLSPEDGASDTPLIGLSLSWHNASDALSYDLFFGESGNTVKVASGPAGTNKSFDLGTLLYNTTYSWKVVEIFESGPANGIEEMDFTTVSNCATNPVPEDGAQEVSVFLGRMLQWDDVYGAYYELTIRTGGFTGDIIVQQNCYVSEYTHDQNWDFGTTYYCTVEPIIPDVIPNPSPCPPLQWQFTTMMPLDEITCWDDLLRLSQNPIFWSLDIQQTADVDASDSRYLDGSDGFSPIGNFDTLFTGSYNGNGHSITGLYINRPGGNLAGLFGYVNAAGKEIKNLNLLDVDITGGPGSTGGLIAVLSDGLVSDCKVTGVVNGIDNVGGLIGYAQKFSGNIQISNCQVEADVIASGNSVGAIAGYNSGGKITDCGASGLVTGKISVGGLVGFLFNNSVIGSWFNGTVNGQDAVGGLIGAANLNYNYLVEDCHVYAVVTGTGISVGGLAGSAQYGDIAACSAAGTVSGQEIVGGLTGMAFEIDINISFSTANVSGSSKVGGFTGVPFGNISNSYARGDVSRLSGAEINYGGFAGEFAFENISNCYSTGSVSGLDWSPTDNGFLGLKNGGTCIFNYWDTQTSGQSASAGQAPGEIEGKTTAEMQQQTTFENWDFANVWAINPAYNDGYPYLQGQISNPTHGGTIAADQSFCQIGTPDLLSSISLPAGYIGNLLYKWQQSTQSETEGFVDIANSNAADFQPEILTTTTWFVRLSRVEGQTYWVKSNVVQIEVAPPTVAGSISGTTEIVYGSSTGDLTLSGHTGAVVKWQRRFGTDGTWEDIANTTALLNEIPTSVGTWFYRAEVQSGVCDPAFTDVHEILVTTKELTIGGTFTAADKVYDGTTFASFYANNLTLTGIVGTDDVSLTGETIVFADPDVADGIEVNITAANLAGAAAGNYSLSLIGSPATNANIIPKDITVINSSADNKVYDGTKAATISGATLGGIVGSDEVYFTSLTGTFAQSNAGENLAVEAALIIGGAQAGNYQLIQPTGLTASIFKAVLTVTAQNASKQYGEANPPLQFAFSNWVAGPEEINIEPQLTTTVDESTPAGFYPGSVEAFGAFDNNYTFIYIAADFTVGASPLLVIADDKDRPYGSANPVFTASYVGLKNGETAPATLPIFATTATAASPVGTYPITASSAADPNYTISYQEGTLDITKAPLLVIADAQGKTYDGLVFPVEQFSVQYEGFVLGENPEVLSGSLTYGTQATTSVNVGTYTIDPSGYSSDNYAISYQTAMLEINKAPLVITADDQIMCQGQEFPELSLSYAGFVNGENSSVLDEQPYGQTYASPASDPGTYAINIWGGSDNNYTLYRQPGVLTILAQPTAEAGNDASICASQSYTLSQATAEGATHISWTSSGDGSFDDPAALNPTYTPGVQDQNNGTVALTITASTQGVCQVSSTMTLSIQQQVVPTVTITSSQNSVCSGTLVGFVAQATHQGTSPVYQWKVNGLPVGGNNASYSYVPQQGDVVTVALSSSEACANPAMVTSNAIMMQVTQSLLTLNTFPENGGMVSMTGEVQIGSLVNLQAQANQGWGFVHWKNAQGTIVSTQASFQYQIQSCGEVLTAYFESLTTLAGQLRYFNALESPMPAGDEGSPFIMQLYQDGNPIGQPQQAGNLYNGMPSTFEFTGLEANEAYTIRLWESPNEDVLSNTWMWNNWGGVTALDALIINMRSTESNTLTAFPWILPELGGTFSPLFTGVADVNQSNSVTALDALIATQRVSGQTEQFPSGRHNFLIAGAATQSMQAGVFPSAPETIFTSYGSYDPAAPATAHYYEATTAALQVGTNYMQLYFVAAGDMNASYLPGTQQKQTIDLHYEGKILAENGSEITIPVAVDAGVHLGALTLEITFDHTSLQVVRIEGIDIYNINNEEGSIKIAWSDVQGKMLQAGDAVFTIQAQLKKDIGDDYRFMEFTGITELADVQAKLIQDVGLKTSYIGKTSQTGQKLTHQVRPNPFSETAAIQFVLPEEGVVSLRIFDQYGQLVKQYQPNALETGSHEIHITSADLNRSGTYFYLLQFESSNKVENHSGIIVFVR